jgi:CDP-glucose 4,6-dehydratase
MNSELKIYENKRVFVTGHTGFKGSWLTLWLKSLGAKVYGYALEPPTSPSLFQLLKLETEVDHTIADIRHRDQLTEVIAHVKPDVIFHLAAQSVVRESYVTPVETIETNVIGTVNVLEAVRKAGIAAAIILVTSDKCYENNEWHYGYRESDPLGGHDPYSASKGAAEILISSWRNSFFNIENIDQHGVRLASVRAGNVIGGGDWTKDQLVPDCIRYLIGNNPIHIRNPYATRPWQHVLEPLSGYLLLGAKLLGPKDQAMQYCEAFNFGPLTSSNKSVKDLVEKIIEFWGEGSWVFSEPEERYHEASLLGLSVDKAYHKLQWLPRWDFEKAIEATVEWYKGLQKNPSHILKLTLDQIKDYEYDSGSANQLIPIEMNLNS